MDNKNIYQNQISSSNPKLRFIQRLKTGFFQKPPHKRLGIVIGVSLGVLIFGIILLQMYGTKDPAPEPEPQITVQPETPPPPPAPTTVASKLTGVQVEPPLNERAITGVMIENSIDARPQAGLVDAGVVFEAIAEGGITRFLALFQESQPDYIGPIRSARPYYVRWARGFDAAYVHSGGSGEALNLIKALGVKDMDHGKYGSSGGTFDRVSNRYAPHNVYTSMARLDTLRTSLGYTTSEVTGFERIEALKDDVIPVDQSNGELANSLTFNISGNNYNTSYTYHADTNTYARVLAGQPHTDERSGKQISPTVVVALEASYSIHSDGVHSVYGNVGSGPVTVFQNGKVYKGSWSKPSDTAELKFLDASGQPLRLQPGQTWITAIQAGKYSYTP